MRDLLPLRKRRGPPLPTHDLALPSGAVARFGGVSLVSDSIATAPAYTASRPTVHSDCTTGAGE